MSTNFKISESDLTNIVLYILKDHPNISTTALKCFIREFVQPGGENLKDLLNRNDQAIDQIIRNIISHRFDSSNNIIYRGLISYDDRGLLTITNKGREYLDKVIKNNPFFK
ncbi:MAG: hypothetical protein PUE12_08420 [Oscillospiraceae bacterium]|nr:hypothetical protein [Oscillospiraceae bacterium]